MSFPNNVKQRKRKKFSYYFSRCFISGRCKIRKVGGVFCERPLRARRLLSPPRALPEAV